MTKNLDPIISGSIISGKNWRKNPEAYKSTRSRVVNGTEKFSPGWFCLGHGV